MNSKKQVAKYIFFDIIGIVITWILFFYLKDQGTHMPLTYFGSTFKFYFGMFLFVLFWLILFSLSGFYNDIFRRSRLKEFASSIGITLLGSIIIFFILILDNVSSSTNSSIKLFFNLFGLILILTYLPRLVFTSITIYRIHKRIYGYPTIIIGDGEKALELYNELQSQVKSQGYKIVGYVTAGNNTEHRLNGVIPNLGEIKDIYQIVHNHKIEEVVIALDISDSKNMVKLINELLYLNVIIKAIPSLYDYLTGRVKMSEIFSAPLYTISFELMAPWQVKTKHFMDFVISMIAIVILSPLALVLCVLIKFTSKGPVLHFQERIGQFGKPFILYKFRSMYKDAEVSGPALSSKTDRRVTPLGRFMRKTRLDEIPNFINVFKGEMSLVGPRPERKFYIDQIVRVAPHYVHLQKVKPGITSWGQVKYGYAENIDQMVERLKYDLLYIENMSILVDIKIIIYTLITVFRGKGV